MQLTVTGKALGDRRRVGRLQPLIATLSARAEATLPQALGTLAPLRAAYHFFATRAVTPAAIVASAHADLAARLPVQGTVLLIQDTTTLNFSAHHATSGCGPIGSGHPRQRGVLVHTTLAVSTDGVPLGLAAQQSWTRDPAHRGVAASRHTRPTAAKESARWQEQAVQSRAALPDTLHTVTIADREADLFDLFAAPRPPGAELLIRAAQQQRLLDDGQHLAAVVAAAPVAGQHHVAVPAAANRSARTAVCRVQITAVALRPPTGRRLSHPPVAPVPLTAILVQEETPPAGATPLCWLLLTTSAVPDLATALRLVRWYGYRWLIERYHFVLKSGCRVEDLLLSSAERLQRAVAVFGLVALQVLWLTYLARAEPDLPCTVALSEPEWQALCCSSSQSATPPASPPTLREATRLIARLGGFLARRSDGEPGPLTIWRGLERLHDLTAMWHLLRPPHAVM